MLCIKGIEAVTIVIIINDFFVFFKRSCKTSISNRVQPANQYGEVLIPDYNTYIKVLLRYYYYA